MDNYENNFEKKTCETVKEMATCSQLDRQASSLNADILILVIHGGKNELKYAPEIRILGFFILE